MIFRAKHLFAGVAALSTAAASEGHSWGYGAAVVAAFAALDCILRDALGGRS